MIICNKCGVEKDEKEFYVRNMRKNILHRQCKACYKAHRQKNYENHYLKYREAYLQRAKLRRERLRTEFRTQMKNYMSNKSCQDCGENDIRVLELDHIEPSGKKFTISQAVRLGYSWQDILLEIEKCQVLCANCHKKRTASQFNWYKA